MKPTSIDLPPGRENYAEAMVRNNLLGTCIMDIEGNIITCNEKISQLLSFSRRKTIGKNIFPVIEGLNQVELMECLTDSLETGEICELTDLQIQTPAGGKRITDIGIYPIQVDNEITAFVVLMTDRTEKVLLQERLFRSEKLALVGKFAVQLIHEIKNPLVPIRAYAQLLTKRYDDQKFRKDFMETVLQSVDRVNDIVKEILKFDRPTAPK